VRVRLKTLLLDGAYAELLEAAEEVMATPYGRGWLDLQRYAIGACDALGSGFAPAASAVRGALRGLLRDLPELPSHTLMDDSPVANAETLAWLRDEGLLHGAEEETGPPPVRRSVAWSAEDRAAERVRAGEPREAIDILMREAARAGSARDRFRLRSRAAGIMLVADMAAVAHPILQDLLAQVETHQLEGWEDAATVAETLGLVHTCLGTLGLDDGTRGELYVRICRLDPMRALEIGAATESAATDDSSW
jgi:type VI secretion system protein ImpA